MTNVKSYVIINEYNEHNSLLIIVWIYHRSKCSLWPIAEFNNNTCLHGYKYIILYKGTDWDFISNILDDRIIIYDPRI